MKKLMIAAAVAAVAGATFAGTWGQVYTATITVKTTTCAKGKVSKGWLTEINGLTKGDLISYRKQGSRTIAGVIWGCGCDEAFSGLWAENALGNWSGNVFWDKKTGAYVAQTGDTTPWDDTTLTFPLMHRIGAKATEVEMVWTLAVDPSAEEAAAGATPTVLTMAGFGTITDKNLENGTDCDSVIKTARGNVAGTLPAPYGSETACAYCVGGVACTPWVFCDCGAVGFVADQTAASGTWVLTYNKSASDKLSKTTKIVDSYTGFPKSLKAQLVKAEE